MTAPPSPAASSPPEDPYADEYAQDAARSGPGLAVLADRRVLRAAAGLLRERVWWRALAGVVLISVVFVLLGQWQWHRHLAKHARIDRIVGNYDAAPVPLADLLPSDVTGFPTAAEWRPAAVSGEYVPAEQLLVRNRPYDGTGGYEVLVPLRTADGRTLVVDRGWVPAGRTGAGPDTVPAPPAGRVDVVVRLRPSEPATDRTAPAGQTMRIDLPELAGALGRDVLPGYGVLATESPRPSVAPALLLRPSTDGGPHVAYTFQWYAFTLAAYVMFVWFLLREAAVRVGVTPRVARRSADTPPLP